jgi:hypothetical protein
MAGSRAGLKKVTKVVRGKKGSVKRSYWVKAGKALVGAAALAGGAYLAHKAAKRHGLIASSGKSMVWKGSVAHPNASKNIWKGSVGHSSQQNRVAAGSIAHSGGGKPSMQARPSAPGRLQNLRDRMFGAKVWKGSVANSANNGNVWKGSVANSANNGNVWSGSRAATGNRRLSEARPRKRRS